MTTAHKCDRCGDLFERKVGDVSLDINIGVKSEKEGDNDLWDTGYEDFDLCTECSKAFREFAKLDEWIASDG